MTVKVVVAGATGWTGSAVVRGVLSALDLVLAGAVARRSAGEDVGLALGGAAAGVRIVPTVAQALEGSADVLVDYTAPEAVKVHTLAALQRGVSVVVGTSGLTGAILRRSTQRPARPGGVSSPPATSR